MSRAPFDPEFFCEGRLLRTHEWFVVMLNEGPPFDLGFDPRRHIIFTPIHGGVSHQTQICLEAMQSLGFPVCKAYGSTCIDIARNLMASRAIRDNYESSLFVDADIRFDPEDAVRLFASDEPVIGGGYAAKATGPSAKLLVDFRPEDCKRGIRWGKWGGVYEVKHLATGFMRIKTGAFTTIRKALDLPLCRIQDEYGWPFFMSAIVERDGELIYHHDDYAFCERCTQAGIPVKIDTRIRLYHIGDMMFGIEEATGVETERYSNLMLYPGIGPTMVVADDAQEADEASIFSAHHLQEPRDGQEEATHPVAAQVDGGQDGQADAQPQHPRQAQGDPHRPQFQVPW